jgi:D-arabinose 5-phosphate isomerase GutQ
MPTEDTKWKQVLLDKVNSKNSTLAARSSLMLKLPDDWLAMVNAAAKTRNISVSAYARRALMSFVAHDLGQPFDDIMQTEPGIRGYAEDPARHGDQVERALGQGHGQWVIQQLDANNG